MLQKNIQFATPICYNKSLGSLLEVLRDRPNPVRAATGHVSLVGPLSSLNYLMTRCSRFGLALAHANCQRKMALLFPGSRGLGNQEEALRKSF